MLKLVRHKSTSNAEHMRTRYTTPTAWTFMKEMPPSSVDLTITSPPYDDLRNYEGYEFDFHNIAEGLYRVTKRGGVVVWVVRRQGGAWRVAR